MKLILLIVLIFGLNIITHAENYFIYKILPNGDFYFNDIFKLNSIICESGYYSNYNLTLLNERQYTHIVEGIIGYKFIGHPPVQKTHITITSFYAPMTLNGVNQFGFNSSSLGQLKNGLGYYKFSVRQLFPFTIALFTTSSPNNTNDSNDKTVSINLLTLTSDYSNSVPYFEKDFWKNDKGLKNTINIIANVDSRIVNENLNIMYSYIKETECISPSPPQCQESYLPKRLLTKDNLCINYAIPNDKDSACIPVQLEYCNPKPKCSNGYNLIILPKYNTTCPTYICQFSITYNYIDINK